MAFIDLFKRTKNSAEQLDKGESIMEAEDPLLSALISGERITRDMALSIPKVSSSVRKITDTVCLVPFNLYRRGVDKNGKRTVTEVTDDPRTELINSDPHDTLDAVQLKKALVRDYLLGRGGYAYIGRSRNRFISLNYVKDTDLSFMTNSNPIFKSYSIMLNGKRYYEHDFLKILRNTTNGFEGVGVLEEISKAIEAAFSALLYMLRLTKTGGIKKGFLLAEKKLSKDAMTELKQAWLRLYSQDTENVVILNNGMKFQDASQTPMDMQLEGIRSTLNNDIREAFGIEDKNDDLLTYTIKPIIKEIESALDRYMLLEDEKDTLFWKADLREIDKAGDSSKRNLMTVNEARYKENMPEKEGLDIIPMSLGTVFFDVNTGQFYTPNTGQTGSASYSGEGGENE